MVSLFEYKKTMWDKKWDIIDTLDGKKKKTEHVLNWLHPNRTPDQKLLDGWAKMNGKIWGVLPVKYEEPDKEFIKIILGTFSTTYTNVCMEYVIWWIKEKLNQKG